MKSEQIAKKGQLNNYCLFIASQYFESADDFANVEIGCKRFKGNISKFFYNPIPLNLTTRRWFNYLRTLYLYSRKDEKFKNDKKIKKRVIQTAPYCINQDQKKILENWTGLRCGEVVFDSDEDNWKQDRSVFNDRIIGRNHLVFLIEDEGGEKFGYYLK